MTDAERLQIYIELAPFLAEVCGVGCEIVIHDITTPEHSLVSIYNGVSGREVGNPLTDFSRELIEKGTTANAEYLTNYRGKSKKREFSSSTYFIKNEGRLIGLLCINKDMSAVAELNNAVGALLERFNLSSPPEGSSLENLENPVANLMHERIEKIIAQSGVAPSRMSLEEKVRIVHRLDEDGVLMMKGAVAEIAACLSVSVPTVYRYLNKDVT